MMENNRHLLLKLIKAPAIMTFNLSSHQNFSLTQNVPIFEFLIVHRFFGKRNVNIAVIYSRALYVTVSAGTALDDFILLLIYSNGIRSYRNLLTR